MLSHLHIENYALIRQSDINFNGGFVTITGETGAGKSILLGALALLLGQRADVKVLFDQDRKCVVEAHFDTKNLNIRHLFSENDVDYSEDGLVIIRREILPSGKSRAFVDDTPVGVSFLRQLGEQLIDIHSQHATLLLGDSGFQISLLDSIAANKQTLEEYHFLYRKYIDLKHELERLNADEQQNRKDYDYNKFLFDELVAAKLSDGEQEDLEQESSLLANAEGIKQTLGQVVGLCDGEEDCALTRLNACKSLLGKIASLGDSKELPLKSLYDRLDSSLIELSDIVSTLETAGENIVYSPERQQEVDDRLGLIYKLQKKHGVDSIAQLLEIQESLDARLQSINSSDQRIHEVMEAVDVAYKALQKKAEMLTVQRQQAAESLEKQISPLFADLCMADATLKASVSTTSEYTVSGNNHVSLLFNANKGSQLRELSKIASGGEMSRLMLAIKSLTARAALLPTVIFDEIDTGISGDISIKVGRIMQRMAEDMQVIAITHLPQIAARASQHFKVYKGDEDGRTASKIKPLSEEERVTEVAVMLSTDPPSAAAIQTARELMTL